MDTEFEGGTRGRGRPLGQKNSEETRAKIRAAQVARWDAELEILRATLPPEEFERRLRMREVRRELRALLSSEERERLLRGKCKRARARRERRNRRRERRRKRQAAAE